MDKHNADYIFFKENIEPCYVNIIKFLMYAADDENLVYDIAQDTMEAAWKYVKRMKSYSNIEAALIQIAKNNLKKHHSKKPVWIPLDEMGDVDSADKTLEEIVIAAETAEALKELFQTLDQKYARVLILHYYYELSLKDIADMYGKNYNTVLSWHNRAIKKLREWGNI